MWPGLATLAQTGKLPWVCLHGARHTSLSSYCYVLPVCKEWDQVTRVWLKMSAMHYFCCKRKILCTMGLTPIYEAMCHNHPLSKPPNLAKVLLNSHLKGDTLLRGLGFRKRWGHNCGALWVWLICFKRDSRKLPEAIHEPGSSHHQVPFCYAVILDFQPTKK